MTGNRGVAYISQGKVEVQTIPFPKLEDPRGRRAEHGVILKVVSTNICGFDKHIVRDHTAAPEELEPESFGFCRKFYQSSVWHMIRRGRWRSPGELYPERQFHSLAA
jgi:hypothetical protein